MKKCYVLVRMTRYEQQIIRVYAKEEECIKARQKLLEQYPMGNYACWAIEYVE